MKRIEIVLRGEDHGDGDINPHLRYGVDHRKRIVTNVITFESQNGERFQVYEGELYTIRYDGQPLHADHGLVREVRGLATIDDAGHFILEHVMIEYDIKFLPQKPPASFFLAGYIPGTQIYHDNMLIFQIPKETSSDLGSTRKLQGALA